MAGGQHPPADVDDEVETRDVEVADGIAQERTGEGDVETPELGRNLVLLGKQALAVRQTEVALELDGPLAHLLAADPHLDQERTEFQLADVEIGRRLDILRNTVYDRDRPPLGDEIGGVDAAGEPGQRGDDQESGSERGADLGHDILLGCKLR